MSDPLLCTLTNRAIALWNRKKAQQPKLSLAGKVIVITGGSSGNGRATALECAVRGASLVLAARGEPDLQRVGAEVEALGARVLTVPTDISERAQVDHLLERTLLEFGRVDVWFNNAADAFFASAVDSPLEHIEYLLRVNVWGTLYGVRAAVGGDASTGPRPHHQHDFHRGQGGLSLLWCLRCLQSLSRAVHPGAAPGADVRREERHSRGHGGSPAARTPFFDKIPNYQQGGSRGGYLAGPTLDPEAVGRAVADGMVRFRPTIYPLASSQVLAVMNELWPTLMDRTLANLRADVSQGPYTSRVKGSHRNESETPPRAQIEVQHSQTP